MFSFAVVTIVVFGIFKGKFMQELSLTVDNLDFEFEKLKMSSYFHSSRCFYLFCV